MRPKRIYWWRFFFDTLSIKKFTYCEDGVLYEHPYVVSFARMIVPCSDKYRPPRARNDNVKLP
jgi:hypothetical protein